MHILTNEFSAFEVKKKNRINVTSKSIPGTRYNLPDLCP